MKQLRKLFKLVVSWFDDDWHRTYLDGNLNHGQGPQREDDTDD